MTPKFSIVTAVRNGDKLLDRTIASVRAQTFGSFEWIVVDGKSTDDSLLKLESARDIISCLISESDEGIADAWNKGLRRASGDFVLILNAGDTYDPDFLRVMAQHSDESKITCSHARRVSEEGKNKGVFKAQPHKLYRGMHLPHNWCAVPRHYYEEFGFYKKLPLAMDFEWFHRYYRRFGVAGFHIVDQDLGTYYLGGTSDVKFVESFRANELVLVTHGANPFLARSLRLAYTLNHALKCRLIP